MLSTKWRQAKRRLRCSTRLPDRLRGSAALGDEEDAGTITGPLRASVSPDASRENGDAARGDVTHAQASPVFIFPRVGKRDDIRHARTSGDNAAPLTTGRLKRSEAVMRRLSGIV